MFFGRDDVEEYVSVVGTPAFMDFVESINGEGVILEKKAMGTGAKPIAPMVIEVDKDNPKKDIEKLDIVIPIMSPRIQREYKNLAMLDVSKFGNKKVKVKMPIKTGAQQALVIPEKTPSVKIDKMSVFCCPDLVMLGMGNLIPRKVTTATTSMTIPPLR